MDIGTKKEPGRMLSAEEIMLPAGGQMAPIEQAPPQDDGLGGGDGAPIGATDH